MKPLPRSINRENQSAGGKKISADRQFMSEIGRMGGRASKGVTDAPETMRERAMRSAEHLRHETHRKLWVKAWMSARNELIDELKDLMARTVSEQNSKLNERRD